MNKFGGFLVRVGNMLQGGSRSTTSGEQQQHETSISEKDEKKGFYVDADSEPEDELPAYEERQSSAAAVSSSNLLRISPDDMTVPKICVRTSTSRDMEWARHPSEPSFYICGRCYMDHIAGSQWRDQFEVFKPTDNKRRACRFGRLAMTARVCEEAVADGSLEKMLKHMKWAMSVRICPKSSSRAAGDIWYFPTDLPSLTVCEECYEDQIASTGFAANFERRSQTTKGYCQGHRRYVKRMLQIHPGKSTWNTFATQVRAGLSLPKCPLYEYHAGDLAKETVWYKCTKATTRGHYICQTCFYDNVLGTSGEAGFAPVKEPPENTKCMTSARVQPVLEATYKSDNWDAFYESLNARDLWPECSFRGVTNTEWYTLPSNPKGYAVCATCYLGLLKPLGASHLLVKKTDASRSSTHHCWANFYNPAWMKHQELLEDAKLFDDVGGIEKFVKDSRKYKGCKDGNGGKGKNMKWWGWEKVRICEACVKGGSMRHKGYFKKFQLRGEVDAEERKCDLHTNHLRWLLREADIVKLLEEADKRAARKTISS